LGEKKIFLKTNYLWNQYFAMLSVENPVDKT